MCECISIGKMCCMPWCVHVQVSVSAMEIIGILVEKLQTKFKPHLPTSKCCFDVLYMCALIRDTMCVCVYVCEAV